MGDFEYYALGIILIAIEKKRGEFNLERSLWESQDDCSIIIGDWTPLSSASFSNTTSKDKAVSSMKLKFWEKCLAYCGHLLDKLKIR